MFTLNCKGRMVVLDEPVVMGIINTTPDSFYAGSRAMDLHDIIQRAGSMLAAGAGIIDIGGQSTRPGSEPLSAGEELERVLPVIEALHSRFDKALISVDTYYSEVARRAVEKGALIINDISAGNMDEHMMQTVASLNVPYICMHMKGTPRNMQQHAFYDDVTVEVLDFFIHKMAQLRSAGINDIIIDPGFGFGKTIDHNFELLRKLECFRVLGRPVLAGLSRKATVYKTLRVTAEEALNGTTVMNTIALLNGAAILRVHDVKEAVEAVKLVQAFKGAGNLMKNE